MSSSSGLTEEHWYMVVNALRNEEIRCAEESLSRSAAIHDNRIEYWRRRFNGGSPLFPIPVFDLNEEESEEEVYYKEGTPQNPIQLSSDESDDGDMDIEESSEEIDEWYERQCMINEVREAVKKEPWIVYDIAEHHRKNFIEKYC